MSETLFSEVPCARSTPLGLNIPFPPNRSKHMSCPLDLANLVPQKHANVANKQTAKDHTFLVPIWVLGDCFMERQYGAEHNGVRILALRSCSMTTHKLLELYEPCVLDCVMVVNRNLQGFLRR